ncbi:MAG TPA: FkbM family methyltransferase [Rhizobiaceae bacterium]
MFIDLGANLGNVTSAARRYGVDVIAFEPDPAASAVLESRFGSDSGVRIHRKAVGATARTATFYRSPEADADLGRTESTSLFMRPGKHAGGETFEAEVVDVVSFLNAMDSPIGVVKMDIEGAEVECLNAMIDAGLHRRVGSILAETHERFSPQIKAGVDALRERISREGIRNINLDWQ